MSIAALLNQVTIDANSTIKISIGTSSSNQTFDLGINIHIYISRSLTLEFKQFVGETVKFEYRELYTIYFEDISSPHLIVLSQKCKSIEFLIGFKVISSEQGKLTANK